MDAFFSTFAQVASEYSTSLGLLAGLAAFQSLSGLMKRAEGTTLERAEAPSRDCPHCTHCRSSANFTGVCSRT